MTDVGLQGRLSDFTLEEILQLIALQQKTGLLTVDASYPMILAFESGMLVGYRDRRRSGADPLASFLKRYGFFPTESWEHIDFVSRHSNLDLTEILVNEGLTSADELAALQHEAAQEDIFRGMQLRDGRYHFLPGRDGLAGLKGRVRFKVDGLLMEAVRRIDEVTSLREHFYSNDLKIKRSDLETDPAERSANERRLLAVMGMSATLGEIVAQGRMCEFETLHTLEDLRSDGFITIQAPPRIHVEPDQPIVDVPGRRRQRATRRATVFGLVSIAVALGLAMLQPWSLYLDRHSDAPSRGEAWTKARQRAEIESALQLFRQLHGRFPVSLQELVAEGWISRDQVERFDADGEYRRISGDEYVLDANIDTATSAPTPAR